MSMVDVVDVDDSSLKLSKNRVQRDLMFFAVYFFSWDFPANMARSQVEMLFTANMPVCFPICSTAQVEPWTKYTM